MIEDDKQKQDNEKKNREKARCYKRFVKTDDGKVIMADLELMCCANRTSIGSPSNHDGTPNLNRWNTNQTFYHEGMRNVFLYINEKVNRKEKENE